MVLIKTMKKAERLKSLVRCEDDIEIFRNLLFAEEARQGHPKGIRQIRE
jgi:hypothetical protein